MLTIILVLLLLSLWLFYYTDGHHKQLLREGLPYNECHTITDVNIRARQAAADVKALNGRFNDLAPLRQQSLKNAADLSSLTKDVAPLIGLKQKLADLTVKANLNSTALLNLGKTIRQFQAQPINSPDDLNKTLGT